MDMEFNKKINDATANQFKQSHCFLDAEHLASQVTEERSGV